ncbi:MBOAT family O-acyltransferase [Pseudomonas sp. 148P]|uniref:Probable alginate O-acetylase n=1 Tax=Pseudomonas ulcerans TaxID=3115852 RepID=A0ABU7HLC8_9PSED|nr:MULTISPECIES: MBOAT family O-acyltransferase [unclassified Pseudomonas]MEE1920793.1 MBOAT family O-acyltransferase [Pseudomonas sp. 147P]MEE1932306.1 MBOAT family O-acyltransferase [Pseudomonas sp. 148P]
MSLLSIESALCFLLFFVLYWSLCWSPRLQNILLLAGSYGLAASFSPFALFVLFGYTLAVHGLGLLAARYPGRWFSYLALLVLVLGGFYFFKYQELLVGGAQAALAGLGLTVSLPVLQVLVPIGFSFYAFHSVSYVVSINRGELAPVPPLDLALYLAFFPSLIAGPVNRATHLLPQIRGQGLRQVLEPQRALGLIALALVKVFLLSGWLASEWVDPVFETPGNFGPEQILLAVYGYTLQIYFNFSGYTHLVTGIALLLGYRLPANFDAPYVARNLREFWMRWHISLSTFIRDYVYIPLGGNRHGPWRAMLNMLLAMLVSGLWHGASVNFLAWGALHGVGLGLYKLYARLRWPLPAWLGRVLTFHYVAFAWVFFRSTSLEGALDMFAGLSATDLFGDSGLLVLACAVLLLIYPQALALLRAGFAASTRLPWPFYPLPLALFLALVIFAAPSGVPGFIYAGF